MNARPRGVIHCYIWRVLSKPKQCLSEVFHAWICNSSISSYWIISYHFSVDVVWLNWK